MTTAKALLLLVSICYGGCAPPDFGCGNEVFRNVRDRPGYYAVIDWSGTYECFVPLPESELRKANR